MSNLHTGAAHVQEAMDLLQEECAEVIEIVSKIRRFGMHEMHCKEHRPNVECLVQELGDVLCLIDILKQQGVVTQGQLDDAAANKSHKLKKWSNLYE